MAWSVPPWGLNEWVSLIIVVDPIHFHSSVSDYSHLIVMRNTCIQAHCCIACWSIQMIIFTKGLRCHLASAGDKA